MTRIAVGVLSAELCDQHLIAEYRELPRVWTVLDLRIRHGRPLDDIPGEFRFGMGHVRFFLDKGGYLRTRWEALAEEMRRRGFATNLTWRKWPYAYDGRFLRGSIHNPLQYTYCSRRRICERLAEMVRAPKWTNRDAPDWATKALSRRKDAA